MSNILPMLRRENALLTRLHPQGQSGCILRVLPYSSQAWCPGEGRAAAHTGVCDWPSAAHHFNQGDRKAAVCYEGAVHCLKLALLSFQIPMRGNLPCKMLYDAARLAAQACKSLTGCCILQWTHHCATVPGEPTQSRMHAWHLSAQVDS